MANTYVTNSGFSSIDPNQINRQAIRDSQQQSSVVGNEGSEKFFVSIEVEKEEDKPVNINAGMQYKFLPQLLTRVGISTATSSLYFGIGFSFKSMRLDVTSSYHPQLGITPGLSLIFSPFIKR